jgi:hypothetical protein
MSSPNEWISRSRLMKFTAMFSAEEKSDKAEGPAKPASRFILYTEERSDKAADLAGRPL